MSLKRIVVSLFLALLSNSVSAGMTISGTRVIFPGSEREQVVRTNNQGNKPELVQVWVDDGSTNNDVNKMKVPFLVTPPVFRVEPRKGQSVRLIYNGMPLPQDKESVFWFNMLEIPPVEKGEENSDKLELAFRTRIKIFYRPKMLGSSSAYQLDKLRWSVIRGGKKGGGIKVENPTPYYFSFDSASIKSGNKSGALEIDMISPFSSNEIHPRNNISSSVNVTELSFRLLNDYGAAVDGTVSFKNGQGVLIKKQ
ncbi:fimbria/pilus periplasmic chaperone [Rouxiella sp. Mn2063]|uniref:fimbria/pilus periplasmic chaperone n=1 Tax=Rouxiella sp. Mn2063 TaxID=3395262 RepID=UPI003BD473AA